MTNIRRCREDEFDRILAIVNEAAEAYRGVVPAEHWHEPYMSAAALQREIDAGVAFWGWEDDDGVLVGVMGIQPVRDVDLIRHAYVLPSHQGRGIGAQLLKDHRQRSARRMLIGTWTTATWAIRFYERHGFQLVPPERTPQLLRTYWDISQAQIEDSVVLAERDVSGSAAPR